VVAGHDIKVVNNIIHDNSAGITAWAEAHDSEIYGNLVYYNGWKGPRRAHGHGLYLQNLEGRKRVVDNVIFDQFGQGIQIYGSPAAHIDNFHLEGNIVFNNGTLNGEHSRNILIGGGNIARNPVVIGNFMYYPPQKTLGGDHNIGYYPFGMGCAGLRFDSNYIASDGAALTLFKCSVASLAGNTLYGEVKGFTPEQYPNNHYFSRSSPPEGVKVFVRKNCYEPGRANIAVFNWDRQPAVSFDGKLAGLASGDGYTLHNAQNFHRDVTRGVFDGVSIPIPMTRHSVAAPLGAARPPSTFPEFGSFVIIKQVPSGSSKREVLQGPGGQYCE
jgi:hypothetical protein